MKEAWVYFSRFKIVATFVFHWNSSDLSLLLRLFAIDIHLHVCRHWIHKKQSGISKGWKPSRQLGNRLWDHLSFLVKRRWIFPPRTSLRPALYTYVADEKAGEISKVRLLAPNYFVMIGRFCHSNSFGSHFWNVKFFFVCERKTLCL